MGRGKPVEIAARSSATQVEATDYFKQMLARYKPGTRVDDEDALDLAALIERHEEYVQKVGCGVDHFEVMMTEHGTPCFRVSRVDGTGTDFSYLHCIRRRPPSRKQEVSQTFRRVIQLDLYVARDRFLSANRGPDGKVSCAVSGERIGRDDAHMDHRPPMTFEVIVTTFLEGRGMSLDQVPISSGRDEQVSPEISDPSLAEAFRQYHARVARLDLVRNSINLAQSARHRVRESGIRLTG